MTILDELINSIKEVIRGYEQVNRSLSIVRAKEIDEIKSELDFNHTALTLRQVVMQKIEVMPGTPLVAPIFLDWNGFRRKLRYMFDDKKYNLVNILIAENREVHLDRIQLSKRVAELDYKIEQGAGGSNPLMSKLEEQVTILAARLEQQGIICQKFQVENDFLSAQLSSVEKELDIYKHKLEKEEDKSKQLYQNLMQKIAELAEAKAKLETLENNSASSKNANSGYSSTYAKLYL